MTLFSLAWHCAMGIRTDQPIKTPPTSPVGLSRDLVKNSANVFKCLHMFDEGFFFFFFLNGMMFNVCFVVKQASLKAQLFTLWICYSSQAKETFSTTSGSFKVAHCKCLHPGCLVSITCKQRGLDNVLDFCMLFRGWSGRLRTGWGLPMYGGNICCVWASTAGKMFNAGTRG